LHFAKLNVSCWFSGSDLADIWHWGYRREQWTMRKAPADWQPLPEVYRQAREEEQQAAIERFRAGTHARVLERLIQVSARGQDARGGAAA
jgi:hypothetical protein